MAQRSASPPGSTAPIVILLGPPGSGKGTQARMLEARFGLEQVSTGDLLRAAVAAGTPAGLAAKAVMEAGGLVGDAIMIAILKDRMAASGAQAGLVLDGFPRTLRQAGDLDALLAAQGRGIGSVVSLNVDDAAMVNRITGRFACAGCGAGYHDRFRPLARSGRCDACDGTEFRRRADDTEATVRARLTAYHVQTAPLVAHYAGRGLLHRVDAMGGIDAIHAALAGIVAPVAA